MNRRDALAALGSLAAASASAAAVASFAGAPALSALAAALSGCGGGKRGMPHFDGEIVGGAADAGHLLRGSALEELLARPPARRERTGVAILGGGISGLSAAWRLARQGFDDYRVYELEPSAGGNARWGENPVSRYPWAAHYVPAPAGRNPALEALLDEAGAIAGRTADGRPTWAEEALVREPEERLFVKGSWYEGLYPRAGAAAADLVELRRFEKAMHLFAMARDAKGRRAFAIPRRLSSDETVFTDLDRLSMDEWLRREGYRGERIRWFVEYGTRDDFGSSLSQTSAWAGIHYFAARLVGESLEDDPAPFLTWAEGNGRIVQLLLKASPGRVLTGFLVFDVSPRAEAGGGTGGAGVRIRALDVARNEVVEIEADDAVFALPKLVARSVVAPWRRDPPSFLAAFDYAPWLVANVTLKDRPGGAGFPLAWDNVLYASKGLGYVVATHQAGKDHGPTVLTYYNALAGEPSRGARERLLSATWTELSTSVLADLSTAHPELPGLVERLDVYRWGHAMARPAPGFAWGPALRAAGQPLGRLRFAHADLSGLPLLEEAQDQGVRAAEAILARRGISFSPLAAV